MPPRSFNQPSFLRTRPRSEDCRSARALAKHLARARAPGLAVAVVAIRNVKEKEIEAEAEAEVVAEEVEAEAEIRSVAADRIRNR